MMDQGKCLKHLNIVKYFNLELTNIMPCEITISVLKSGSLSCRTGSTLLQHAGHVKKVKIKPHLVADCLMVSPSILLTVIVLSSDPSAKRFSEFHAPHVIRFVCLPRMGIFLDVW